MTKRNHEARRNRRVLEDRASRNDDARAACDATYAAAAQTAYNAVETAYADATTDGRTIADRILSAYDETEDSTFFVDGYQIRVSDLLRGVLLSVYKENATELDFMGLVCAFALKGKLVRFDRTFPHNEPYLEVRL